MRDTRRHADRLVGDSAARRFRIFLSVSETWKSATVGQDGSARSIRVAVVVAASSAGHSGAASATWEHVHRHFAVAALLSPETPLCTFSGKPSSCYVDFDLTAAWRHHVSYAPVKSEPVCGDHSAQKGTWRAIQSQAFARNPFCAKSHTWILGRCGPPSTATGPGRRR